MKLFTDPYSRTARIITAIALASLCEANLTGDDGPALPTATFSYTGDVQTFVVPAGVTSLLIEAYGAQGGGSSGGEAGGLGARMTATYAVTPGQILSIVVGQQGLLQVGGNAQNSSGGGGGTFVYDNDGPTLLVAAAGGGGKCNYTGSTPLHADAAGQITTNGGASSDGNPGGTDGNGGPAGIWSGNPCSGGGTGWLTPGGGPFGGSGFSTWTGGIGFGGGGGGGTGGAGGFGGGGGGGNHYGGGGGGGGYSGGGGGTDPTHGGGGGSYSIGTSQDNTPGFNTGDGSVLITCSGDPDSQSGNPSLSAPSRRTFAATRIGQSSATSNILIRNVGDATLTNLSLRLKGSGARDFRVKRRPVSSLAPGASTYVRISFIPRSVGKRKAVIKLVSNAPATKISLSGNGLRPRGTTSPRFPGL
jgi:hypothetical protein